MIRKRSLKTLLYRIRKIGKNPTERLALDIFCCIKSNLASKYNLLTEKSDKIIGSFFNEIKENLQLNEKVLTYISRVTRIQNLWRKLKQKKVFFIERIKKLWLDNLVNIYYELLSERGKMEKAKFVIKETPMFYFTIIFIIFYKKEKEKKPFQMDFHF